LIDFNTSQTKYRPVLQNSSLSPMMERSVLKTISPHLAVRGEFGSPGDHTLAFWMRALTLHQAHVCSHANPKFVADDQYLWFFSAISSASNLLAPSSNIAFFDCPIGHTFVHGCEAFHFLYSF
jgi:hypothetical protein